MRRWGLPAVLAAAAIAAFWIARPETDRPALRAGTAAPTVDPAPAGDLVAAARAAGNARDFVAGADLVAADRSINGPTPHNLEALSWLGRTALAAGDLDRAERFARETYDLATGQLAHRALDAEPRLPIALGAAIEVIGQAGARRGQRDEAVSFLRQQASRFERTSIVARIQKNVHLISLEGTAAPELDLSEYLDTDFVAPRRGDVVLMFFWAHWCSDCKAQAPVLANLLGTYGHRGLRIVAPTQRFGYVAGGREAPADEERAYIAEVRARNYPVLARAPVPLSAANHLNYGVSTTPTIVLVDRAGLIRLYHPGRMSQELLEPRVRELVDGPAPTTGVSSSD
jgi:thiol-disulfide isomerase/thioredoxin